MTVKCPHTFYAFLGPDSIVAIQASTRISSILDIINKLLNMSTPTSSEGEAISVPVPVLTVRRPSLAQVLQLANDSQQLFPTAQSSEQMHIPQNLFNDIFNDNDPPGGEQRRKLYMGNEDLT
jgi:hypothetical protein